MEHSAEFKAFDALVEKALSVSREEMQRREAECRKPSRGDWVNVCARHVGRRRRPTRLHRRSTVLDHQHPMKTAASANPVQDIEHEIAKFVGGGHVPPTLLPIAELPD